MWGRPWVPSSHNGHGCCPYRMSSIFQTNGERSIDAMLLNDSLRLTCSSMRIALVATLRAKLRFFFMLLFTKALR